MAMNVGLAWLIGWLSAALFAATGWAVYVIATTGHQGKLDDAPLWVVAPAPIAVAGCSVALVASVALPVLNRFTLRLPQWGTPQAQEIPAKRWSLPEGHHTIVRAEIEACYDVTVIREERDDRWVVQDRDGTVRVGTLVLLGEPGPDGQRAVLTYEGLPAVAVAP